MGNWLRQCWHGIRYGWHYCRWISACPRGESRPGFEGEFEAWLRQVPCASCCKPVGKVDLTYDWCGSRRFKASLMRAIEEKGSRANG